MGAAATVTGTRTTDRAGVSGAKALGPAAAIVRVAQDRATSAQAQAHAHGVPPAMTAAAAGPRVAGDRAVTAVAHAVTADVAVAERDGQLRRARTHDRTGGPRGRSRMDVSRVAAAGHAGQVAPARAPAAARAATARDPITLAARVRAAVALAGRVLVVQVRAPAVLAAALAGPVLMTVVREAVAVPGGRAR
ncbi:MAG TPA: hypothetical protein VGH27_22865 [Streptosporangiaceae bacterium]